jgi:beta-lactam-binding protein with PASTA domain
MNLFKFLFSKTFVLNAIIALVITGGGLWYVFQYLDEYTLHGQTITVPDFKGYKTSELESFIKDKQLNYVIADSIFDGKKPKGTVLDQHPKPESQVKDGRKIYLTVNAMNTPRVKLPEIQDLSIRQATARLESYGFTVGELIPLPSNCSDCALGMKYKGEEVEAGFSVNDNSEIDIIIGVGESGEVIPVPFLLNLDLATAKDWLKSLSVNGIVISIEDCETAEDSLTAKIYKQSPEKSDENTVNLGGSIDLWLTVDSVKLMDFLPDSLSTPIDSLGIK